MLLLIVAILCLCIVVIFFVMRRRPTPQSAPRPVEESPVVDQHSQPAAEEQPVMEMPKEEEPTPQDETESKADDDDDEKGVTQNVELVAGLHRVFEEEKVFLRPDIHIEDVAKMLLTNRTYVTRLMRQEYGLSFIEYVNVARIQHSQSLLYTTNMTLDEVAERSGFQSTSNYCRAFKRYIGTTPLAWKNSLPKN